jgi:hypothetical protein
MNGAGMKYCRLRGLDLAMVLVGVHALPLQGSLSSTAR